jgi:hypothetical protein
MAQIAAQRDPNVTIAAQAAEAGAPIPEANPAIRNDLPELDQPAGAGLDQIDSRLDELYAEYDELLQNKPQGRDGDYEMDRLEELRNEIDDLEQMREGAGAIPANDEVFDWNAGNARPRGPGRRAQRRNEHRRDGARSTSAAGSAAGQREDTGRESRNHGASSRNDRRVSRRTA